MKRGWVSKTCWEMSNVHTVWPEDNGRKRIPVTVLTADEVGELIRNIKHYDYLSLIGLQEALKILEGE